MTSWRCKAIQRGRSLDACSRSRTLRGWRCLGRSLRWRRLSSSGPRWSAARVIGRAGRAGRGRRGGGSQGGSQSLFDAGLLTHVGADAVDHGLGFAVLEAQADEELEGGGQGAGLGRRDRRRAVRSAVGVLEGEAARVGAADDERTHVGGSVVGAAEGDKVVRLMVAAGGAAIDVVDVDEGGVTAARDGAPAVMAPDDGSLGGGRDGLLGSAWGWEVDAAELLGVALGA